MQTLKMCVHCKCKNQAKNVLKNTKIWTFAIGKLFWIFFSIISNLRSGDIPPINTDDSCSKLQDDRKSV